MPALRPGVLWSGTALRGNTDLIAAILAKAPPEQLVELLLPHLWAGVVDGTPANICVNACLTLQHAYGQLGIRSEIQPVGLELRDGRGRKVRCASTEPQWEQDGTVFTGHCVLMLPDSDRIVDPTVEQFDAVRAIGQGPLIARTVMTSAPIEPGQLRSAGSEFLAQRGDVLLRYTVASDKAMAELLAQQWVGEYTEAFRRTGVNTASLVVAMLRAPLVVGRARQAPHPRLRALLHAVGDAAYEPDAARDVRFEIRGEDGSTSWLRLDEIPLPATVPAAHPRLRG